MKEAYFTPATIASRAEAFRQSLGSLLYNGLVGYEANRSALLVLDMQRYFLEPTSHAYVPSAGALVPGLRRLIQAYRARQLAIVYTRHLNTPTNSGSMSTWWRELITPENPLSQITPELEVESGTVFTKSQYDAFYETNLEQFLREGEVTQVVITGVMTHLCCETTARSAFMRGFRVYFTIDGTATYNAAFHQATLLNLAHGFATPILVSDVLAQLGENGED